MKDPTRPREEDSACNDNLGTRLETIDQLKEINDALDNIPASSTLTVTGRRVAEARYAAAQHLSGISPFETVLPILQALSARHGQKFTAANFSRYVCSNRKGQNPDKKRRVRSNPISPHGRGKEMKVGHNAVDLTGLEICDLSQRFEQANKPSTIEGQPAAIDIDRKKRLGGRPKGVTNASKKKAEKVRLNRKLSYSSCFAIEIHSLC